jgi:GT2 family glycosyltransferase
MQIIVLGMHRSGTSAVARVLNMMGAYLAPEHQIMPPSPDNPKGYWERLDVMQLNDRILQAGNSDWQNVLYFDSTQIHKYQKKVFYREIHKLVGALDANRPWMLKDPRLCITFPLWREHLELPVCIHVYRNPLQVARSLHKRDGIPITTGLAMWEAYTIAALNNSRGLPNIRLIESAFMYNPLDAVQYLKAKLEACGVDGLRIPKLQELTAFIDTKLLHHTDNDTVLDTVLNKKQFALWTDLHKDDFFSNEQPVRHLSEVGKDHYMVYLKLQAVMKQLNVNVNEINVLHKKLTEEASKIIQLQGIHASQTHANESLTNQNELLTSQNELLTSQNELLTSQNELLTKQIKDLNQRLIDTVTINNNAHNEAIAVLNQKLANAIDISTHEVERCYEKIQQISTQHAASEQERMQVVEKFNKQQLLFNELKYAIEATFMSWRWKVGNFIVRGIEILLGRNNAISVKQRIEQIFHSITHNSEQAQLRTYISNITGIDLQALNNKNKKLIYTKAKQKELNYFLDNNQQLTFHTTTTPKVSIILVLYNRAELTLACLQALHTINAPSIELIIINNASTDRTNELLNKLHGEVKIIRNTENIGFLLACNQAAQHCTGEYVLFLNNDAIPLPGAINNALQVFQEETNVGAVGGKLILLDGSLQEAGSIVWQDGSCYGYGRGSNPTASEFMFRRSVDYCSGAFLLMRRDVHTELNGFDTEYAPAYYEDTDLCLRLHQRGLEVIYEPSVSVLHYEFASAETNEHALNLMRKNQITFAQKHAAYLSTRPPADLNKVLIARFVTGQPRILYIDDRVPHSKYGSGFPRSNFILKTLAEQFHVTLMPLNFPDEETWDTVYVDILKRVEVMKSCGRSGFIQFLQERKNYFDLIFISRPHNMEFFIDVRWRIYGAQSSPSIIYDAEALFSLREQLKAQVLGGTHYKFEQALRQEITLARNTTRVIAVSEHERSVFLKEGIATVDIIGHAMPIQMTMTSYEQRNDILFVGNMDADYSPNVDSMMWFIEHVFDKVLSVISNLKLLLIGSNKSSQIQSIRHPSVQLLGAIDDLTPYYEKCRLMIAPTRFAAGIPYKVHEAAARGIPVVCSELIRTQLGWNEDAILAADIKNPELFAQQVLKLYQNHVCWQSIRDGAMARIQVECNEANLRNKLLDIVTQTL